MSSVVSSGFPIKNNLYQVHAEINSESTIANYRSFQKISNETKKDELEFDKSVKQKNENSFSNYAINLYA